jgi:hypothetical protein
MAYFFIAIGTVLRLVPHLPNFAPITAIALFGGAYLDRRLAVVVPLAAMLVSDYVIGFYDLPVMISVYASFALAGVIGMWLRKRRRFGTVIVGTFAAALLFYLVTNAAVAFFTPLYPHNLQGLLASYMNALPFFRNSLLGDFFYVGVFFGGYEFVQYLLKHAATQRQKSTI